MDDADRRLDPGLGGREVEPPDELGVVREDAGPETAGREREPSRTPADDGPGGPAVSPADPEGPA